MSSVSVRQHRAAALPWFHANSRQMNDRQLHFPAPQGTQGQFPDSG